MAVIGTATTADHRHVRQVVQHFPVLRAEFDGITRIDFGCRIQLTGEVDVVALRLVIETLDAAEHREGATR